MVIIIGHSGFIGRHLFQHFKNAGRHVVGISSRDCDLTQPKQVRHWFADKERPFHLIHAAVINRNQCHEYAAFLNNCKLVQNVLAALPPGRCRSLIYLSSVDVYGNCPPCPITEQTAPAPAHYYALSKWTCEQLLRLFPGRGFPVAILRLPGVYGAGDCGQSLLGKLWRQVNDRQAIILSGNGCSQRDLINVDDLATLVDALLDRPQDILLNVASGKSLSLLDIIALIGEKCRCQPTIILQPDISPAADLIFNSQKLRDLFPRPIIRALEDGIDDYHAALDCQE